jgi:hypothetical protein
MATGLVVACATPAVAAPILVNGGFETGDFTGWTQIGNTTFNGVQCPGPGPTVFQGNCSAFFGPIGSTGGISQNVTGLTPGAFYNVAFAFLPDGGNPSSFSASFGATPLVSLSNPPASPYQVMAFVVQASGASQVLAFNFRDDPGFLLLDAVSVTDSTIPEPATLTLFGIALSGLGLSRLRSRRR